MVTENRSLPPLRETRGVLSSRRRALALMLGAPAVLAAAAAPLRFAISESVVGELNLNDARAAMSIWLNRLARDHNVVIEPRLFATTQEIQEGVRRGQFDAIAVNAIEYRPIAEALDSSQLITSAGAAGMEQYLILAKQNSGIRQLGDLKGRRLCMLNTSKMCLAPAWLFTLLEEGHYGPAEQFFGAVVTDVKFSRVVLPVFFGQADACLTSKRGFDTMCELNPQVGRDLKALASSPTIVVSFYIFRRNYQSPNREILLKALLNLRATPAGGQLATLFQFDELVVRDATCLTSVLGLLDAADRARGRRGAGGDRDKA
jgi:phosphonate transport system substrate-binding protein